MKKTVSILLTLILIVGLFAGCGGAERTTMNVYAIKGPTGIGMVSLMEAKEKNETKHDYNFTVVSDPTEVVGKITSKEADIAAVPTNMASTLYKKTSGAITVLALNTSGNLFIMEKGNTINTIADLKGKTVYSTGQGANPEFAINYILKKNNLTIGTDVKVEFLAQNDELIAKIKKNDDAILLVPQPIAATALTKVEGTRLAIDVTEEFEKAAGTEMYMGCIIVRNEFLKANEAAVKEFIKEYKKSVEAVLNDNDTAATLCEKYQIIPSAAIAKKAIPQSGVCYVDGAEMKTKLNAYLEICKSEMPKLIGGEVPVESFYYLDK